MNHSVSILQIRDSSYNIGYKTAEHIKDTKLVQTFERVTSAEIDYKELKRIFNHYDSSLLVELEGLSDGLNISIEKGAALFSGYDVPKTEAMGCSSFMTNEFYIRNYDFGPQLYDGLFSMYKPTTSYATAGYNLQVLGRHDGINEKGLVIGLHFVSNKDHKRGISAWTAVRMVLDTCATTEEAIYLLKEIPHAACYNFSVGDKTGKLAVVEASSTQVIVRTDNEYLGCVNHFIQNDPLKQNREDITGSTNRYIFLQKLGAMNLSAEDAYKEFLNKQSPLYFTNYSQLFGTLHTFSYNFKDSTFKTTIPGSEKDLIFSFNAWVTGDDISQRLLKGKI